MKTSQFFLIITIALSTLTVLTSCEQINEVCDGKDTRPDLIIPSWISQGVLVNEARPCFIGNQYNPFGAQVGVVNAINEFYSIERYNWIHDHPVIIYWNQQTPPPFNPNDPNPVLHPPYVGETIKVHRFVQNQNYVGFFCAFMEAAGLSTTRGKMRVRVVGGQIVEAQAEARTPQILPGAITPVTMDFVYQGPGNYQFDFEANYKEEIEERDMSNNVLVEVSTQDLGS